MKALNCKLCVVFLLLMFGATSLFAKEIKKTLSKEFKTNSSTVISMETKFSELTVETWNKNVASFDVTIVVDHNDEEKAQKMLDLFTVEFDQDGNEITVETKVKEKFFKINWGKSKSFKFLILAKIPASVTFDLANSLGDVEIGDLTGTVNIESNLGDLAINSLSGTSKIVCNHSEIRIGSITNGNIEVNSGEAYIEEADNLNLNISKAECDINKAGNIDATVNMSDFTINEVVANFEDVIITSNVGNIDVSISEDAGFTLNSEMNMGNLNLPSLDKVVIEKPRMNGSGSLSSSNVKGTYGNGKSSVKLTGNMGNITLKIK